MYYVLLEDTPEGPKLVVKPLTLEKLVNLDLTTIKYRSLYPKKAQAWADRHCPETVFDGSKMPFDVDCLAVETWDD